MLEHNRSHVVKSGQGIQGTETIDGAKLGYQKQQPNIAMSQSQKLTDNSAKRNMHDPEAFNPHKIDNINEATSSGFQKNGHRSKNKFRMYGSKRCLPAYTVLLRGQDYAENSKIQNISLNMSSLPQNDYKSNPKSQGPLSISNEANHRKLLGAKKAISPSLTIIEPDSRRLPRDSEKQENKQNFAFRNEPSLTIVPKQSRNDKRKSSLPKARMIGTQRKIRARIDEIGFDLEPIERNENSRIQQNNQINRQNETKLDSKRNKENESDELNVNKLEEAQKKFLYEEQNNENKARNEKTKENQAYKDGIEKQSKKQNDDSLGQTNRSLINQTASQEQKKQFPRHITNLTVFNKFPSVVLTPSKKVKAYVEYVQPESKESKGFRRGHFLEEQGKQINQPPKSNNNNSSQDPTFILVNKSNTKDMQPLMLGVNCHQANGKKEQSSLQLKIQSRIEGNNSNIEAADDRGDEKDPLLKKQEQPTKQKQEQQKNKKRPTIVLNSSKSINAYFQFLEDKQPNKKANKAQNANSTTANELTAKAQATRSESKKKMTMIGSHKSIQPYFENIEQQPAGISDQNVAGNSESDRIIEDEVQEGFDRIQQDLLENQIANNKNSEKQRKNSVKQLSSEKNVKAYVDYIEEPKNETVPKETKDIEKGTVTNQKNDFKFNPSNYEPITWFTSYNSKNNQQPFQLADKEVDHKKTSISMSSRKQLRSQIDLILQGELGDNQPKARNENKNRSSKISDPNSSRRQLSSLKNINAYKQLIEEPNKSQQIKEAVNNKKHQQNNSINKQQSPSNGNTIEQKQQKKVQVLDAKEAATLKPDFYPIMDWYTTYNKKNTSSPYQLNNRQVQKKKGISSRKDIRSQIDLILEEEVKKDDGKHLSNSNSKISQNASSMKQLSSLKNVKAYVQYIEKPQENSEAPVDITTKLQQSKKQNPSHKKCDKKEQQLTTDHKQDTVHMKFNPQSYPQINWYACYNQKNENAPFEINDKPIEEKKEVGKKINDKQKVQEISKQKASSSKPINQDKNSTSNNKNEQKEKPQEVKQADKNLAKKNQDLPVVKQYSFTPSAYPIVGWYTGYDPQQPQSCFILSDKQQNIKLNEPEQKVKNCEDDTKDGQKKPYGKYLSYSQMSDSVVRMDSKLNEDELKGKNGGSFGMEDTNKLTELQNNENIVKKQSNQTDLNDLPADLSGTKGEDNFILPQKGQNQKSIPVKEQNDKNNVNQNPSQVSKQKSQSKSSKLSLSRGSEKNLETKSNGTQKLINQQVQINTKALIEDAYNKLQVQQSSKEQKGKSSQLKKEQKNSQKSKKVEKSDKATTTEKKPEEKIKNKQDLRTIEGTQNEVKKTNIPNQGQQTTKKEGDKKQAKKQRNSKQVQKDLQNIKKQQDESEGNKSNKVRPNENKSLSKRGSQIQLIPINADHDKIDRFQEQELEQEQESKARNNQNKSENLKNQNQFNNNSLSNRSLLSKSQEKGSLKALVRVSPKLQRSQRKSNDSILVDQEEDYEQQVKLEKISPKKIPKQSQNKPRISRRPSNQKIRNEGENNQIKKVGLYKFKQTIQSKQNQGSKPKRASNAKNEDLKNRIVKRSEESERYCPKTPTNQSNSGQNYSSQNNRNKQNKNKKGKAVNPYLQPVFMALRSEKSPKNNRYSNEEKRQAHSNNIIEEDSESEASRRLRKQGIVKRNKKNNMAYNERQIQKLKAEYQKIKKIEQSSQQRRQKTHKIRSIQNERQVQRSLQSEQQIRSHKFLRAHSHQFSYLYPTAQNITENDKLAKKAKQLNQKLKRCSYTLGKRRQIDEVHEFISQARKQVRQSQKYLEQLE